MWRGGGERRKIVRDTSAVGSRDSADVNQGSPQSGIGFGWVFNY